MKIFAALVVVASAASEPEESYTSWNGYIRVDGTGCNQTTDSIDSRECEKYDVREVSSCGAAITSLEDMRNATCLVKLAYPYKSVYAGNGAFIVGSNYADEFTLAGFDATSGNVQLVIEYLQDDGYDHVLPADLEYDPSLGDYWKNPQRDNSTCFGNIDITCTPTADGNGVSDPMFMETINADRGAGIYNFQVANYGDYDSQLIVTINDHNGQPVYIDFDHVNCTQAATTPGNDGQIIFTIEDDAPMLLHFSAKVDRTPDLFWSEVSNY